MMDFKEFIKNQKLSDVKLLLLKALWGNGNSFPRAWVTSDELLKLSGQKYFDRRLRELRDKEGLDLESSNINGNHSWRLKSASISQQINRTYLTASQKDRLFKEAKNLCATCGKSTLPGVRGLQADHKVPLTRGGGENIENWQALCNECNVAKRRACQDCTLDCNSCSWAYPEKSGRKVIISIPRELELQLLSKKINESQLSKTALEAIKQLVN